MRQLLFICTLLLFYGLTPAQSTDSILKDIRKKYRAIHENLHTYDTTFTEISGESTEGGQGTAYYEGNKLKLIEIVWLGEMGKRTIEYYFDKDNLIFAFEQTFEYNRPIYWDEETAKENEDDQIFNPDKTVVKENRYYFNNKKLFLWLDNDKKEVNLKIENNSTIEKELISHAAKMKQLLEK